MRAPTFVLDVHLGKLARHLRMVGFDTLWSQDFTDPELLKISNEEHRILLTRDRELHDLAPAERRHYVQATEPGEQLREVVDRFGLKNQVVSHKGFLSRCLECNSPIVEVNGEKIRDRVPAHLLEEQKEFYFCPRCERVYWKGSHFERMKTWVKKLFSGSKAMIAAIVAPTVAMTVSIAGLSAGSVRNAEADAFASPAPSQKSAKTFTKRPSQQLPDVTKPPYSTFVDTCMTAFNGSVEIPAQTSEHGAFGKAVCQCTAGESKLQGVTQKSLETETKKIQGDPKYKISDPKLLAALQYCTLKTMDALPPESDAQ